MQLRIKNKIINGQIKDILLELNKQSNYKYLNHIKNESNNNIAVSCPFHKDGQENHPSCFVYTGKDNDEVEYGYFKCFTCGEKGHLYKLVSHCLSIDEDYAKDWLTENFSNEFVESYEILPEIELKHKPIKSIDVDLEKFNYYHPYLEKRKISKTVANEFKVGYNKDTNSVTFPVWNDKGTLVGITERNVETKHFNIPSNMDKPIYLLNFIKKWGITSVFICESQINTLTLWTWGFPAIGLIGTGSKKQYEILNKSGIRTYHCCFDGDEAGDKGYNRFKQYIRKDCIVDKVIIPRGKDVNDLTKEDFMRLGIEI